MAQDIDRWLALVNTAMNLRVPYEAENLSTSLGCISFSTKIVLNGII
jgi:hypothetical protein